MSAKSVRPATEWMTPNEEPVVLIRRTFMRQFLVMSAGSVHCCWACRLR